MTVDLLHFWKILQWTSFHFVNRSISQSTFFEALFDVKRKKTNNGRATMWANLGNEYTFLLEVQVGNDRHSQGAKAQTLGEC